MGGAAVSGTSGLRGRVDADALRSSCDAIATRLDDGRHRVVPARLVAQRPDGTLEVPFGADDVRDAAETEYVRAKKTVTERDEVVPAQLLMRERVQVRHVPVNRYVDEAPRARTEGDTLVMPIVEEVLEVQKRLLLRAEVRVSMTCEISESAPQSVALRRESIAVEASAAANRGRRARR
jgi:hypothetical protein